MRPRRRRIIDHMLAAHRQTLLAHSDGLVRQDTVIETLAATVAEQRETIRVLEARLSDQADQLAQLERRIRPLAARLGGRP